MTGNSIFSARLNAQGCGGGGGGGGGGGRYSDTFIHTYARVIFWAQNFEFQFFFCGFQKIFKKFFWSMKILWIFFSGHHKIGLYLVVRSMHFRVFFKVKV